MDEDEFLEQLTERYEDDPATTAIAIAQEAAEQAAQEQLEALAPYVLATEQNVREARWQANADWVREQLDARHPVRFDQDGRGRNVEDPGWRPHAEQVQAWLTDNFGEYAFTDREKALERAEAALAVVRPRADADAAKKAWDVVKQADSSTYSDLRAREVA